MRTAFAETVTELAAENKDVMLVVGDLGFGVVVDFAERFPNQFLNVGVAEQNMTGVAAGLALAGKVVFTYSIANFPTLRCLEQIRNDVCYHNANVIAVAVGGGMAYGALGMSHHATEDLAIMRSLPNLTVLAPGDPEETRHAVRAVAKGVGPVYLRLGRAGEPDVHQTTIDFEIGKALETRSGNSATIISTGGMLATAVEVADRLEQARLDIRVLSMHSIHPLDKAAVVQAAEQTELIVTLEEHSLIGGLGGAVAEVMADHGGGNWRLRRIGLPSEFSSVVGDQDYLKRAHGLDVDAVLEKVRAFVAERCCQR